MSDAAFIELLASYEAALEVAHRSIEIARALAEGHRSGVRPPEFVVDAYLASLDRDQTRLGELRATVAQYKSMFRVN